MAQQRWLRIIPVALIMYMIAYIDRTNISLALEPQLSSLMKDLHMNNALAGQASGVFFLGYTVLQMAAGYWALRWGGRRLVSVFLAAWGICAIGCGLARTFGEFGFMRFLLGVAESGVFPATAVLFANWFPESERARSTAYWLACQPLAVAVTSPITSQLLGSYGWQKTLILEGLFPILWLPVWWFCIRDFPHEAKWISAGEKNYIETTLAAERAHLESAPHIPLVKRLGHPSVLVAVVLYFFHNCAAYGCMTFFTRGLKAGGFSPLEYGILFALPYALSVVVMIFLSRHSDKTRERRLHLSVLYLFCGTSLLLSVLLTGHFWLSYVLLCLAIPGPFAGMPPFWAVISETQPRIAMGTVMGLVNALGNLGGWAGPAVTGWLTDVYHNTRVPFGVLGAGMILCSGLALLLPKSPQRAKAATGVAVPSPSTAAA